MASPSRCSTCADAWPRGQARLRQLVQSTADRGVIRPDCAIPGQPTANAEDPRRPADLRLGIGTRW